MNLTEQYSSRLVHHLLGFPRNLLYRTPADAADLRAALLRLIADEQVYHKSTRAASAGQPNRRNSSPIPTAVQSGDWTASGWCREMACHTSQQGQGCP